MNDSPTPAELDAAAHCDAAPSPLAPPVDAAELAAELPSDDAPLPSEAPPPPPERPLSEVLDEMGIEAAKLLALHLEPLGFHALVIVTDSAGQQFSFRSATLGPNATYGLLCRVKALAKRFYCSF